MVEIISSINHVTININDINPIELTQSNSKKFAYHSSIWCLNSRLKENQTKGTGAGTLATVGSVMAGIVPYISNVKENRPLNLFFQVFGAGVNGLANLSSAYLSNKKDWEDLVRARTLEDFPNLFRKVFSIDNRLEQLLEFVSSINVEILNANAEIESSNKTEFDIKAAIAKLEQQRPWYWNTYNRRNFIRLFLIGGFTAAGSWLVSFYPSLTGLLGGSVLQGVGNYLSTSSPYEFSDEAEIKIRALEQLSKLVEYAEENEKKLVDLIKRIQAIRPDFIIDPNKATQAKTYLFRKETPRCFINKTRDRRNTVSLNAAFWLSTAGTLIGSFYPTTIGGIISGGVSSTANIVSNVRSQEKLNDEEIKNVALQDIPQTALKIAEIATLIAQLTPIVEAYEKYYLNSETSLIQTPPSSPNLDRVDQTQAHTIISE